MGEVGELLDCPGPGLLLPPFLPLPLNLLPLRNAMVSLVLEFVHVMKCYGMLNTKLCNVFTLMNNFRHQAHLAISAGDTIFSYHSLSISFSILRDIVR